MCRAVSVGISATIICTPWIMDERGLDAGNGSGASRKVKNVVDTNRLAI
jgi:hypothetical protein